MPDKSKFHVFLNHLKDEVPSDLGLIESIQEKFDEQFDAISAVEKKALKQFPAQFIKRIPQEDMGWTTQLHAWGEQSVSDILNLDPMLLSFKNGYGDSVLMCLVGGATGLYTETIDYDLLQRVLDMDFSYEDVDKDDEDNEILVNKNVLDETDINGQTPLDFLFDFAFAKEDYEGMVPDQRIQNMLVQFAKDGEYVVEEEPRFEALPGPEIKSDAFERFGLDDIN